MVTRDEFMCVVYGQWNDCLSPAEEAALTLLADRAEREAWSTSRLWDEIQDLVAGSDTRVGGERVSEEK